MEANYWRTRLARARAEVERLSSTHPGSEAHALALAELRRAQGITHKSRKLTVSRPSGKMSTLHRKG